MAGTSQQTVLITGAASGIGRALALDAAGRGYKVIATDLNLQAMESLGQTGIHTFKLDVTSADDITALVKHLDEENIQVDMLINNAGFGAIAPVAEIPVAKLRTQFEVNVFAIVALSQALIPAMVARKAGRIVNIGSVSGVMTTPFAGAYCASKAAVHALSDAMRMELAPLGVQVITVQPGGIRSDFGKNASAQANEVLPPDSMYQPVREGIISRAEASQEGATPAEEFARKMLDAVLAEVPPPVVRIGKQSSLLPFLKRYMPTRQLDNLLSRQFQLKRLNP